jgi:2,4-dienoyl-CoA reductase-like NADH-dependent reductase (Old Yellow Enzyme family)
VLIAVTDPPDPLANIAREASAFAQALETHGCAAIHVSSGGLTPVGPSHQVPLARAVKRATRISVIAVGLITEFEQAEAIVGTGDADPIALARTILYNPRCHGMPPRTSVGRLERPTSSRGNIPTFSTLGIEMQSRSQPVRFRSV